MAHGFMYLVAVIDWHSRFILSWQLSNTLEMHFCLDALELAFTFGQPDIFNTDQGSQFTAHDFTQSLLARDIRISMDGRGRALDNIFIERFWRSLKYENIYIHDYPSVRKLKAGLTRYFYFYNQTIGSDGLQIPLPLIQQYGLKQGLQVIIEFETGHVRVKSMQLTPALIEQQALQLTRKHLGNAVTVKAIPQQLGWQVELYGIDTDSPLGYLMYDANGARLSDIGKVVEQIFAAIGD